VADEVAASVEYERFRLLKGLPDTPEIVGRIPLECNLDLLNYISFTKGCYVGQELVSRTKFRGLLRKRVLPYIVLSHVDSKGCDGADAAQGASRGNEEIEIKIPESLDEWSGVGVGMFPFAQPSVPPKKIDKAQETVVRSNFVNKVVLTFQPDLFLKTL
jgi:folate-binding protein YgfZ